MIDQPKEPKRKRKKLKHRPKIAISKQVTQAGTWWCVRPRVQVLDENNKLTVVQRSIRLCLLDQEHPDRKSVEKIAEAEVAKLKNMLVGTKLKPVAAGIKLGDFVEREYSPNLKKKPSTINGYKGIWERYFAARCADAWLGQVRTVTVTDWLADIFEEHGLSRTTLHHAKHFLSGVYKHTKARGFYDGVNPVEDAGIPDDAPEPEETGAYSLQDVFAFLRVLPEPGATICAVAGFTGMRAGEIRGLRWEDYEPSRDEDSAGVLRVTRSVWRGIATAPKSRASRSSVPMIPQLQARLEAHRALCGSPANGPIFANGCGNPLSIDGYLWRVMLPILRRCSVCKAAESEHENANHQYKRDESMPVWFGWHGFRRGLATNLNGMGVDDKTIQLILRHANVKTTQDAYIKGIPAKVIDGMKRFSERVDQLETEFRASFRAWMTTKPRSRCSRNFC